MKICFLLNKIKLSFQILSKFTSFRIVYLMNFDADQLSL